MAHTLHPRHTRDTDTDTRATAVNTMAWFILTGMALTREGIPSCSLQG